MKKLKVPFDGERRVEEEGFVVKSVINEVAADLPFRTNAEMTGGMIPELGLGKHDELSVPVPFLTPPQVDETGKSAGLVSECRAPYSRELNTWVGTGVVVALEIVLVHQLYRTGLGEIG